MLIMTSELTHTAKGETETFNVTAPVSKSGEGKQARSICSVSPAIRSRFPMVAGVGGALIMIRNAAANAEILSKPWQILTDGDGQITLRKNCM